MKTRREFLHDLIISSAALTAGCSMSSWAAEKRVRRILLRSSWATVNIGDIAHSPGVIALLQQYLPEVEVTLWPSRIGDGVEEMLRRNFPKLRIAQGEAVNTALAESDFFLHGSGASLVAQKDLARWRKLSAKPYGIYGITLSAADAEARELINGASFIYFRDTLSLKWAKENGLKCPVMEFAPDGAFACKLRNETAATAFLQNNGLEEGKFLCAIPRLRYTPYWQIYNRPMTAQDRSHHEFSQKHKEADHAKLREAIVAFVRQTGLKVLVCPEDQSHMAVGREMLVEPLPDDVKSKVVWHERYWLTDEAISTYARALALLSMDMHSPILAIGTGTPAIHCRFKEQTSKGQMWRDIGLGEWLFDLDEERDGSRITRAVLDIASAPEKAREKVAAAAAFVHQHQQTSMATVRRSAGV